MAIVTHVFMYMYFALYGWWYIFLLFDRNLFDLEQDKTNKMTCAQQRLRLAWASVQSDQSLHCSSEEGLGPWLPS